MKKLGDHWEVIDKTAALISADYYQSCLRAAQYPAESRLFGEGPENFETVKKRRQECDEKYIPAQKNILGVYAVYTEYLKKLSTLANKSTGQITTQQKDELTNAVKGLVITLQASGVKVPEVVSNNVSVGTGIIAALFDFLGDGIRRKTIPSTIVCTNDEIETYTTGLIALSSQVYVNQLTIERGDFESHFTNFTPAIFAPTTDGKPGGRLSVQESYDLFSLENIVITKDTELRGKEEMARQFSAVLNETSKMHGKLTHVFAKELDLTRTSGEIDAAKRDDFCKAYEEKAAQDAMEKSSVEKFKLSSEGATEIYVILSEYHTNVDPLITSIVSYQESFH